MEETDWSEKEFRRPEYIEPEARAYPVTYFAGFRPLIGSILIGALNINSGLRLQQNGIRDALGYVLLYLDWIIVGVCIIHVLVLLIRWLSKPIVLTLEPGALQVGANKLTIDQMECIMIREDFRSIVGIKPKGKRIPPMRYVFRFVGDQDKGLHELEKWADLHHVQFKYKRFMRWI